MQTRQGHYMKPELLQSQFATLEPPGPEEALKISITESVEQIINQILNQLEVTHE